ncbi:MAG: phospholipase A [Kordiimonadaceae bacterium]|nr:phospholipase A [Kordiimonadaceae bacterium]
MCRGKISVRFLSLFAFVVWGYATVMAQEVFVSVPETIVFPGDTVEVTIALLNSSDEDISVPSRLAATMQQEEPGLSAIIELQRNAGLMVVLPGEYQKILFKFDTPDNFTAGYAHLHLNWLGASPLILQVHAQTGVGNASIDAISNVSAGGKAPTKSDEDVAVLGGLSTYKPVYFLGAFDPQEIKFQISFKYQLFSEKGTWATALPLLSGFHVAYTQVSYWDLEGESRPFEDTNFLPEIFYALEDKPFDLLSDDGLLDFQLGLLHESNGRGGEDSRSLNIVYGRAAYEQPLPSSFLGDDLFARLSVDLWSYFGDLSDNPDIAEFRGHNSVKLLVGKARGIQLSAYRRGRIGSGKSSYLFDLTTPIRRRGATKNINFNLHAQLFTGYGDNLLTYDQKETRFRLGIGLHR